MYNTNEYTVIACIKYTFNSVCFLDNFFNFFKRLYNNNDYQIYILDFWIFIILF